MHKEDAFVMCPYYKRDGAQAIHCEGVQEGCGLRLGFAAKGQLKDYKALYCHQRWENCMIAKMLNRKYDYEP